MADGLGGAFGVISQTPVIIPPNAFLNPKSDEPTIDGFTTQAW